MMSILHQMENLSQLMKWTLDKRVTRAGHREINAGLVLIEQSFTVMLLKLTPGDPRAHSQRIRNFVILLQ